LAHFCGFRRKNEPLFALILRLSPPNQSWFCFFAAVAAKMSLFCFDFAAVAAKSTKVYC